MASRTFTKTKTKTRTKHQPEDESSGGSSTTRAETSTAGASKRYVKAGRSLSSTPLNTSIAIASSDEDDDFAADIVANIEAEEELRKVKKANGGRLPRKKQKESKSEKQTQHTRKLLREGESYSLCLDVTSSPLSITVYLA
jgi:cysteine synthase